MAAQVGAQVELTRNDTLPNIGGTVSYDLTGYTITLHINFAIPLVKTATILTATITESTFEFVFAAGDLSATAGTYGFELQFDDGFGGIITHKKDIMERLLKFKLLDEIS